MPLIVRLFKSTIRTFLNGEIPLNQKQIVTRSESHDLHWTISVDNQYIARPIYCLVVNITSTDFFSLTQSWQPKYPQNARPITNLSHQKFGFKPQNTRKYIIFVFIYLFIITSICYLPISQKELQAYELV